MQIHIRDISIEPGELRGRQLDGGAETLADVNCRRTIRVVVGWKFAKLDGRWEVTPDG